LVLESRERSEASLALAFDTHRAAMDWGHNDIENEKAFSVAADFSPGGGLSYENFLPEASFPIIRTRSNANGIGALFFLFFSAFGFFFSRLLLNWPFATLSSFACGEYSV
jgi:hypothetical protein